MLYFPFHTTMTYNITCFYWIFSTVNTISHVGFPLSKTTKFTQTICVFKSLLNQTHTMIIENTQTHFLSRAYSLSLSLSHTLQQTRLNTQSTYPHDYNKKIKKRLAFWQFAAPIWLKKKSHSFFSLDTTKKIIKSIEMEILFRPLG